MNAHLNWDTLNAYADATLTPDERSSATRHLDTCTNCRRDLERLREVLAAAHAAPASITAPESAWRSIRETIESQKLVSLHQSHAQKSSITFRLVAAAALLVVTSSTVTVLVLQRGRPIDSTAVAVEAVTPADGETPSVSLVRLERGYINTVNELRATLDSSRTRLAPETIRAVERSLKIIDDAIAEAREALVRDPASDVLRDALSRSYEQKVDLLRRASAHASTSE